MDNQQKWLASIESDILEADPQALEDTFEARKVTGSGEITKGAMVMLVGDYINQVGSTALVQDAIYRCTGRSKEHVWLEHNGTVLRALAEHCVLHMSAEAVIDEERQEQLKKQAADHEAADKLATEQAELARAAAEKAAAAAAAQVERDATAPALDGPLAPGCRVRLGGGGWSGQVGWVTGVSVSKGTVWLGFEGRCYQVRALPRLASLARLP